jgi:uncharacterized protein YbaP (TraB family)
MPMKSLLTPLSLLLASLLPAAPATAESPVWIIEKDGRTVYLGGTVHILDESQYPLPPGFDAAYSRAQTIVLETDLVKMQDPEFLSAAMVRLTYPEPETIRDYLEPGTYEALEAYFTERGLNFSRVERFRPGLLISTMLVLELQRLGLGGTGADMFVHQRAASDEKPRRYLETVDEQIDYIAGLGAGEEEATILYSLADMKQLATRWQQLLATWRVGDLDRMQAIAVDEMQHDFPRVYDDLLVRRNLAWVDKIERMLEDEPIEFVVVGALHLGGEDGLLELLAARGCQVEQLP